MAEPRPTEKATGNFGRVKTHSRMAHSESTKLQGQEQMYRSNMAVALYELGEGMENLTVGIRATYLLLEDVKRLLELRR